MEFTHDSFIKFSVESVLGVYSFQNSFLLPAKEFEFCNLDQNALSPVKFESKHNNSGVL